MKSHGLQNFIVFALLALVLIFGAYGVSTTNEDVSSKEVAAIEPAGGHQSNAQMEKDKPFLRILFHDPTAFFTMVLACFTMGLAIFTFRLFEVTRDGIEEQASLTRESITAAIKSADALTASERSHVRIQRVNIDPAELFTFDEAAHGGGKLMDIRLSWTFQNFGKTPAEIDDCMIRLWIGGPRYPGPDGPVRQLFQQTLPAGEATGENGFTSTVTAHGELRNRLVRKQTFIRAEIFLFYYDIFQARHVEHVRWRYDNFGGGDRFAMIDWDE